jgi:hypothetical protein
MLRTSACKCLRVHEIAQSKGATLENVYAVKHQTTIGMLYRLHAHYVKHKTDAWWAAATVDGE